MCRFADSVDEADIRGQLDVALRGKGAFRRFRDVVFDHPDLKESWSALRKQAILEQALAWLEDLGIAPIYTLRQRMPEPAPSPSPAPKVGVLDLLLLGAPDGKTERLNGQILRQIILATPSEARALFQRFARELCEWHGIAWRKRFVEDTSRYDVERAHLEVEGNEVRLYVDVPASIWKAFSG